MSSNQVLILAGEAVARAAAEIARSLDFTPVVAASDEEAVAFLDQYAFHTIAVSGRRGGRVRSAARTKQPSATMVELPESNPEASAIRRVMLRQLRPSAPSVNLSSEERHGFLKSVLESFTATLDLREVEQRIASVARDEFRADRAWLIRPVSRDAESARVVFSSAAPGFEAVDSGRGLIPLERSRNLIDRATAARTPIAVHLGDLDLDPELAARFEIRSLLVQILQPGGEEPWALGIHQCGQGRAWTGQEIDLFQEIGRYATLALTNALLHDRAVRDIAKISAILDQIPESAVIYDARGRVELMNTAAQRDGAMSFSDDAEEHMRSNGPRHMDGRPLTAGELPSRRARRGELVRSDYLIRDVRNNDERIVNFQAAPIRDEKNRIIGSVVLSRDVTNERQDELRESWRRRRAECLAELGLESLTLEASFDDLEEPARRVAAAIGGTVQIYLYRPATAVLELVGWSAQDESMNWIGRYFAKRPYRAGEGLPGTVFQIGLPLLFYEIRGNAVVDFARDDEEKKVKAALREQSLIACPIESYGERIGALVLSRSDAGRSFDADDLEFAQSVAERIGAASYIHHLTRMEQEGHRAAEDLARREVDARVRFETVLETAPIGIAVVSADELRFELANARFMDFASCYGKILPDSKIVGLHVEKVLPGSERVLKGVAETGETRVDEAFEVVGLPQTLYVNRIISPVRGRFSGITQTLTVLIQDVTDQVRAKREIEDLARMMAERSARLDSILGSMTDALWVYDSDGHVVDVNQAALTMFGLGSRTEAIEHESFARFQLRYPDGRPMASVDLPHSRALRGQTVPDYLAMGRHLLTGKDLDLSIAAAPIESNGVVGAVLVIRDITALQELDRKKDEFLSVASHELRTPLTTIKGYTQLLAQTVNDLSAQERITYLNAVLSEVERMMGLISELLDVSRIETNRLQIHRQAVRWVEFLERRAVAFRVQNPSRTINFAAEAEETIVDADPDRMRQVIDNLLSNAVKYSPEGSEIDVRIVSADGMLCTSVIDRGIGIPADEIPRLFERFHRARNVSSRYYGGLGLGLYIAKAIVEAHDGCITVVSDEGQGSIFSVLIPQAQA